MDKFQGPGTDPGSPSDTPLSKHLSELARATGYPAIMAVAAEMEQEVKLCVSNFSD